MAKTKKATKKSAKKKAAKKPRAAKRLARSAKAQPKAKAKPSIRRTQPVAKPTRPTEVPTDIAARLGRKSAEIMVLDGENTSPGDTTLQEWAYDWFLNAGGFDAIKGSDDANPAEQAAIKQSFFDAFKTAMRTRLNLAQPNALG